MQTKCDLEINTHQITPDEVEKLSTFFELLIVIDKKRKEVKTYGTEISKEASKGFSKVLRRAKKASYPKANIYK